MNVANLDKIKKINNNKINLEITKNILDEIGGDVGFKLDYIKMIIDSDYSKRTVEQSLVIFRSIKRLEDIFNKDVYNFDLDQTHILLGNFKKSSLTSLASEKSLLEKYILFAHDNNKVNLAKHPILNVKQNELNEFVNTKARENKFITYQEYRDILDICINAQDKAILVLAWNDLVNKDLDLIRGIKFANFEINQSRLKILNYLDEETGELIDIDVMFADFEIKILENAYCQTDYIDMTTKKSRVLKDSEYLFKTSMTTTKIGKGVIFERLKNIAKLINNRDLKIKSIRVSGIYNRVSKLNLSEVNYIRAMMNYKISRGIAKDVKSVIEQKTR